ncbi:HotDog domain-containing protein [Tricharina praecox]|uniref:HotDog domain-containing protein n=1 Tax=Tricharina praecox TaxID=43433 RepID=UPI002220953C|nr:HotDog domain-containing protein [Tricharina praecox]KAI5856589.1 HotDog domain-containing protein [Tricharina praecox]
MSLDISALHKDFTSAPWVMSILTAATTEIVSFAFVGRPRSRDGHEDSLTAVTFNTDDTFRAYLPVATPSETCTFISVGDGLNGHEGILHGGAVSAILDIGLGAPVNTIAFTAFLNVTFKKPLPTPRVVVCRARITKSEVRKKWVAGTLEDGEGTVYATGECLYVEAKPAKL